MVSLGDSYTSGEGLVRGDGLAYDCGTDLHKGSYYENTSVGFGTRWDEACDTVTQGPPPIDYKSRPIKVYENLCHRHGRAWPNQVRESLGIAATNALFVPCSGAIAANLGFLSSGNWAQYWQRLAINAQPRHRTTFPQPIHLWLTLAPCAYKPNLPRL